MIINPRYGVWMSITAAVVSVLLLCGTEFTTLFGTAMTLKILAALGIFNVVINSVNGVLHMIPANTPPTAAAASQFLLGPAVKAAAVFLIGLFLLHGTAARADCVACVDLVPMTTTNSTTVIFRPICKTGWLLLTYPGTATAVCAREIRPPIYK
jgi:hypothetical protein